MTDVTNNHVAGLGMPDGTSIASRETKSYENWAVNAANGVVAHWVATGLLSVDGYEEDNNDEPDEREKLIADLAELGVEVDGRTGLKKLRAMLEEKLAEAK